MKGRTGREEKDEREERAAGGRTGDALGRAEDIYEGEHSNVAREAEEKKRGGRAKRRRGGHVEGDGAARRPDRPGRRRGGRAGSDMAPLTTASKIRNAQAHDATEGNAEEGP